MMVIGSVVKQIARQTLFNHFLQSIAACTIFVFSFCIVTLIASLISVFAGTVGYFATMIIMFLVLLSPMLLGVIDFLRRLLWNQENSVLMIFRYFSSFSQYKRAVRFVISMFMRISFAAIVLYLPNITLSVLSNEQIYESLNLAIPVWVSNLWTLNSLLAFISTLAFVFVTLKYYLAPFIFVCNDDIDYAEAINMSVIISKRTGADFFGLVFSFAGWILISVLLLPLVFTMPYFVISYSEHCRFAISEYNKDVDIFNMNVTPSYSVEEL